MLDLMREIEAMARLHEFHDCFRAVMRRKMEIAGDFMQAHMTFDLAALLGIYLLRRLCDDDVRVTFLSLLSESIYHTFHLAVLIKGVLVEASFYADLMHTCHINDIKGKDGTRRMWQY